MKRLACILCIALSGCAGSLVFIGPDSKIYPGNFDSLAKTVSVTIEGQYFSGPYITNSSVTTGYSSYSGTVGAKPVFAGGPATAVSSGSQGRALLTSQAGGTLSCEFNYQGMSAIGTCQDQSGKVYQFRTQ